LISSDLAAWITWKIFFRVMKVYLKHILNH